MGDPLDEAARLNSLAATNPPNNPAGPLSDLWDRCPSILSALPFMGNDDQRQAARAYVYASGVWLADAVKVYPQALAAGEYPDTVTELAGNIATITTRRAYLVRLGYEPDLDGVTGAAADLVKKFRDALPSGTTLALGGAALLVIGILILVIALK